MPYNKTDVLDLYRTKADLADSILALVKESGLAKPKRRAKRKMKAKRKAKAPAPAKSKAATKVKAAKPKPTSPAIEREEL